MFEAIASAANALDPEMAVVPYLSTGATDSSALRRLGINAYGLLPFPMIQSDEERMHGHDERVPIASLVFGTRLIYESVIRVVS
jgi:acetylornithine deacetylase/succinyl-diaminopimelate desuccinylase-like protein